MPLERDEIWQNRGISRIRENLISTSMLGRRPAWMARALIRWICVSELISRVEAGESVRAVRGIAEHQPFLRGEMVAAISGDGQRRAGKDGRS